MPTPAKAPNQKLSIVYDEMESLLKKYVPPFTPCTTYVKDKRNFNLISEKEVVALGRKRNEMWFCGVVEQKGYIGFYYMPIYCIPKLKSLPPGLMRLLKGKSCFYLKQLTPELRKEIRSALKIGFDAYKKLGWV